MKVLKIDNISFNGKADLGKNITKVITQNAINSEILGKSLLALASVSAVAIGSKKQEKSFEKTLEENYFKLPEGAEPDVFQKASAGYLYKGNDVLVTAPTGTGKTAIAHYVITKNFEEQKKTFYTTPLKALSNEKFRSFQKIYGEENVGLITGDTKINKDAPIVIMTTEVYRNMVFGEHFQNHNPILENLKTVIFDELHYLGDTDRGGIWEQSIILSNPETQLLSLSATIGNNTEIAKWMAKCRDMKYHKPTVLNDEKHILDYNSDSRIPTGCIGLINVPSENRHVPLEFNSLMLSGEDLQNTNIKSKKDINDKKHRSNRFKSQVPVEEDYRKTIIKLKKEDKLPAIFFIFSKKGCKKALGHLVHYGNNLNSENEVKQLREIIERYKSEGKYLGETLNIKGLEKGYAIHNAGLLPTQKELIEELFQKKLVKVVLATETLSAGINMPARTTVISSYLKPTSDPTAVNGRRQIMPNEFHQMAGRAGRRGIDTKGYCYTMSMDDSQKVIFDNLISSKPNDLKSAFNNPDYSFVASYYDVFENDDMIRMIAEKSFFTYDTQKSAFEKKCKEFMTNFGVKRKILRKFDYIDSAHSLKTKGLLIKKLNGYEQIPIINAIDAQRLANLSPVELASVVGAFATIRPVYEGNKKEEVKVFHHKNQVVNDLILAEEKELAQYNEKMKTLDSTHRAIEFDANAIHHIYNWANSNDYNDSSTENWTRIMKTSDAYPIRDEGSLFKEISMTVDLLKQITEICDEAIKISQDLATESYYRTLKTNALDSIRLLSQEPIQ